MTNKKLNAAAFSFYRPHDRSATWATGQLFNNLTGELTTPPSRTKQSFVAECDINNILKQYRLTGQIAHMRANASVGAYEDLPDNIDFQEALNTVLEGQSAFASLPSAVRNRFGNDPAAFLAFMADPSNQDEIIKLGLAVDRRSGVPTSSIGEPPASSSNNKTSTTPKT